MRICPPDPLDSLPLQSPRDPAQSRGDTEVGTKEFVSIVRTDPFTTPLRPLYVSSRPFVVMPLATGATCHRKTARRTISPPGKDSEFCLPTSIRVEPSSESSPRPTEAGPPYC